MASLLLRVVALLAPTLAVLAQEPPAPDPTAQASESWAARRALLEAEAEALPADAPNREELSQLISRELWVIEGHEALQSAQLKQSAGASEVTPEALTRASEARDAASSKLVAFDPELAVAELDPTLGVDGLRASVAEGYEKPLTAAADARKQAAAALESARSREREHPAKLDEAKAELAEWRRELAAWQERLTPDLEASLAKLVRRRMEVRGKGVAFLEEKVGFLESLGPYLALRVALRELELAAAEASFSLAEERAREARELLSREIARAQADAERELQQQRREVAASRGSEKLLREQELTSGQISAETIELRSELATVGKDQARVQLELSDAESRLEAYRAAYEEGEGERERPENVLERIRTLERRGQDLRLLRRDDRADRRRRAAERTRQELQDLDEDFGAILESARRLFLEEHAGEPDVEKSWQPQAARWRELHVSRRALLQEKVELLEELSRVLASLAQSRERLRETLNGSLLILQRGHLFLRGESHISLAAIQDGFQDMTALPAGAVGVARSVLDYFTRREHVRSTLSCAALLLLAALGIFIGERWISSRLERLRGEIDEADVSDRVAISLTLIGRSVLRGLFLLLLFWIPATHLPDLTSGTQTLLRGLAVVAGTFWVLRRLISELLRTSPRQRVVLPYRPATARRLSLALRLTLYLSLVYWPIDIALSVYGYSNRGAVELARMVYQVLMGLALLTVLVRRSIYLELLPAKLNKVGRLLRLVLSILHPLVVLLVPGLLLLVALRYQILAGLIASFSLAVIVVATVGYLLYHGCLFLLDRWIAPEPTEEHHDDEDLNASYDAAWQLGRFVLRVVTWAIGLWAVMALTGRDLSTIESFFDVPLPMQEDVPGERLVTFFDVILGCVLLVLAFGVTHHAKATLQHLLLPRTGLDSGLQYTITTLVGYVVLALGLYLALSRVFDLAKLGYVVAALSIGIGFGLQEIISNFISGLILLFERPLKVGDMIQVGETEGVVRRIQIRSTTVQTRDNVYILVPNRDLITQNVTNLIYTDPKIRVRVRVGVAYGSDTALVRKVLMEVAHNYGKVLKRPGPEVWFIDFGDSSLDFDLLVWFADPINRHRDASQLRFAIEAAFQRYGITIPFPQRDLHVRSVEAPFEILPQAPPSAAAAEAATTGEDNPTEGDKAPEEPPPERPKLPG